MHTLKCMCRAILVELGKELLKKGLEVCLNSLIDLNNKVDVQK